MASGRDTRKLSGDKAVDPCDPWFSWLRPSLVAALTGPPWEICTSSLFAAQPRWKTSGLGLKSGSRPVPCYRQLRRCKWDCHCVDSPRSARRRNSLERVMNFQASQSPKRRKLRCFNLQRPSRQWVHGSTNAQNPLWTWKNAGFKVHNTL